MEEKRFELLYESKWQHCSCSSVAWSGSPYKVKSEASRRSLRGWYVTLKVLGRSIVQEDIAKRHRVQHFSLDVFINGKWKTIADGSAILFSC